MSSQQDQAASGDSPRPAGGPEPAGGLQRARQAPAGKSTAGKVTADGRTIFRSPGALILFWAWVAIAVFALGDLAVQGHNRGAVTPALIVLVITSLMYACCLRPRVAADADGVSVQNPLRDYRVPWGAIEGVYLGDSVELQCSRQPPRDGKTVYCWALYSSRRSRIKASISSDPKSGRRGVPRTARALAGNARGQAGNARAAGGYLSGPAGNGRASSGYGRMPAEAQDALTKGVAENIAAELGRMLKDARSRGHANGCAVGSWAWQPLAAIVVSAVALALAVLL